MTEWKDVISNYIKKKQENYNKIMQSDTFRLLVMFEFAAT